MQPARLQPRIYPAPLITPGPMAIEGDSTPEPVPTCIARTPTIHRPHPFPTDALPCPRRRQRRRHSPRQCRLWCTTTMHSYWARTSIHLHYWGRGTSCSVDVSAVCEGGRLEVHQCNREARQKENEKIQRQDRRRDLQSPAGTLLRRITTTSMISRST